MRPLTLTPRELAALADQVFERAGTLQFEARGGSMRPLIRSGDLLTCEPVDGHALQIGEVALYRTPTGQLVAHRLIHKLEIGTDTLLHFRGDANLGEVESVEPGAVLGRVTTLQRTGRTIHLESDWSRLGASLWHLVAPVGARALHLGDALRQRAARAARAVQGTPTYRRLGRQVATRRVCYRLGTAADAHRWTRFHRVRGAGATSQPTRSPDDPLWTRESHFTMLAMAAGRILGVADVVSSPELAELYPDWWLFGMQVGPLFRGLGIGEGIVNESLGELRRLGAERLYLKVFTENERAVAFYRKLGFARAPPPLQEAHLEANQASSAGRPLVILTRSTRA